MDRLEKFRALDLLMNEHKPTLGRRNPFWMPTPPKIWREVHVPGYKWTEPNFDFDAGHDVTYLDAIASYVTAASSAKFAHGELKPTGRLGTVECKLPGYYLVDAHPWNESRMASPLGSARTGPTVWITQPTLENLYMLARHPKGYWPTVTVHDSYTCEKTVRLSSWATAVNTVRAAAWRDYQDAHENALVNGNEAEEADAWDYYENVIKLGYAQAFQMMLGKEDPSKAKARIRRPDWNHTVVAQAAANTFRLAFKAMDAGYCPLFMGSRDEVAFLTQDVIDMTQSTDNKGKPFIKFDPTGTQLGHWKVKPRVTAGADA